MKTILTKKQQIEFLSSGVTSFKHVWSNRGYGNSKLVDAYTNEFLAKAGGCGYDRFGTVLGEMIERLFQDELNRIGKRHCKGGRPNRRPSEKFYGLFYNSVEKRAYLDGGCGASSMEKVLNKIGFSLKYHGEDVKSSSGVEFYELIPIDKSAWRRL